MYCTKCGSEIPHGSSLCTRCGRRLYFNGDKPQYHELRLLGGETGGWVYPSRPPKSLLTAFLLSLFLVGFGQVYLGQIFKGLMLCAFTVIIGITLSSTVFIALWGIGLLDVFFIAKKLDRGNPVRRWECF